MAMVLIVQKAQKHLHPWVYISYIYDVICGIYIYIGMARIGVLYLLIVV